MFHVVRQRIVHANMEATWSCLTQADKLAQWFGDADSIQLGSTVHLDFGDGDYFVAKILELNHPTDIRLAWRFMGIGQTFDVRVLLAPHAAGTEVTVIDHGSLTLEEVDSLREGWDDFLSRLARFAENGGNARYDWSQTIGIGVILGARARRPFPTEMIDRAWLSRRFPDAELEIERPDDDVLTLRFNERVWAGRRTEALLESRSLAPNRLYLGVVHKGWEHLPAESRISERKRYAGLWREVMAGFENDYGEP